MLDRAVDQIAHADYQSAIQSSAEVVALCLHSPLSDLAVHALLHRANALVRLTRCDEVPPTPASRQGGATWLIGRRVPHRIQ